MIRKIALILSIILISLAYQNCGEVKIAPKNTEQVLPSIASVAHSVQVDLCLKHDPDIAYDLSASVLVINLTALPHRGSYVADSDMDGLSDELEKSSGLQSQNSRSRNSILDSICYKTGQCPATCSDATVIQPGLKKCDSLAYTNIYGYQNSFDSDNDGIPDFVEIIRGSDPFRSLAQISPGQSDLDQDGRSDLDEIRDQTDPSFSDAAKADNPYQPRLSRIRDLNKCPNGYSYFRVSVPDQPFVDVDSYVDPAPFALNSKTLSLSHEINENVIMIYVPVYEISNPSSRRALVGVFKIKDPLHWPESAGAIPAHLVQSLQLTDQDLEWTNPW